MSERLSGRRQCGCVRQAKLISRLLEVVYTARTAPQGSEPFSFTAGERLKDTEPPPYRVANLKSSVHYHVSIDLRVYSMYTECNPAGTVQSTR